MQQNNRFQKYARQSHIGDCFGNRVKPLFDLECLLCWNSIFRQNGGKSFSQGPAKGSSEPDFTGSAFAQYEQDVASSPIVSIETKQIFYRTHLFSSGIYHMCR